MKIEDAKQVFEWLKEKEYLDEEDRIAFYEDFEKMKIHTPRFYNLLKSASDR